MRYVAIGDSFTEGVGDQRPDGSLRGWADNVAAGMAAASSEPVHYANLAVRGRLLEPILTDQLGAALALSPQPTLISLNGGGNDMMRPGTDLARLIAMTEQAIATCTDAGIRMLLLSGPDPSYRLPMGAAMRRKGDALTEAVAAMAGRFGLPFVDMFHDVEVRRPRYWSPDRLHLNAAGHRRVADAVLAKLGYRIAERPPADGPDERRRLSTEVRYYRQHVLPWVGRRVTGRSSGDGRSAKHLSWTTVSGD